MAENYDRGWDVIAECWDTEECASHLETVGVTTAAEAIEEMRQFVEGFAEQALNARWGEDGDPELRRYRNLDRG